LPAAEEILESLARYQQKIVPAADDKAKEFTSPISGAGHQVICSSLRTLPLGLGGWNAGCYVARESRGLTLGYLAVTTEGTPTCALASS
jgi:hypothetical protein